MTSRCLRLARPARPFAFSAAQAVSAVAAFVALLGTSAAQAETIYKVTELLIGPKSDVTLYSKGKAINKGGKTAVEYGYSVSGYAAARCAKAVCTQIPELQVRSFPATSPSGINDLGHVTGSSFAGLTTHAFLWDGTQNIDLGGLPEDGCGGCMLDSYGRDINNKGQVAGLAYNMSGSARAFFYKDALMKDIGTLGGDFSAAYALNDKSDVVGVATLAGGAQHAFLYRAGLMTDLGTLGGSHSTAFGINELRQVVGCSTMPGDTEQRGFIHQAGAMTPLPPLGGNESCALGINRNGWAVGYSSDPVSSDPRGVLWQPGGPAIDLNAHLDAKTGKNWVITEARAINDNGLIVVTGEHKGITRAALLTPVVVDIR
jgi:probable HAF family extracellular repeat protein